tara:strand:- start:1458 stop:1808 length:351 start_codon:yes stop_codon:yes gene_type:complete
MSEVKDEDGPVIEEVEDGDSGSDEDSESESESEGEDEEDFWFPEGESCERIIGTTWGDASTADKAYAVTVARGTQALKAAKRVAHVGFIPLVVVLGAMSCEETPTLFQLLWPLPGY